MTLCQALFLALVQGVTEFLPISSSGHLVLFQKLFKLSQPSILFDVLLHFGTLLAIIFFLRNEIYLLIRDWRKRKNEWLFLIVGSVPAGFFGFLLNFRIEEVFNSLFLVGVMWILFGGILLSTRFLIKSKSLIREKNSVGLVDGLVVGLFQAVALFPGVSRSGSTIIGSLWRKLSPELSFKFSFLLAIPAILGATVLQLGKAGLNGLNPAIGVGAVCVSGIVGFLALNFLEKTLRSNKFYLFGCYCLGLGVLSLLLSSNLKK